MIDMAENYSTTIPHDNEPKRDPFSLDCHLPDPEMMPRRYVQNMTTKTQAVLIRRYMPIASFVSWFLRFSLMMPSVRNI